MDYLFTEEEEAFRQEVRRFLRGLLPQDWAGVDQDMNNQDDLREVHELGREVRHRLGARGWLEIGWPREYGGRGASITKQLLLEEELYYHGVPGYDQPTFGVCGPLIMQLGTQEQKKRFLSPIARGGVKWAVGMSEPGSGSDFASLQLRAEEQEDCFLLNGQKTWQSGCHMADWCIVFARTAPNLSKRQGMSALLVDLKSPGITMRRLVFMSGVPAADETYYDNVRVPRENLLGEMNGGWRAATACFALDRRCGFQEILRGKRDFEAIVEHCKAAQVDGQPLARQPVIRNRLAEMAIKIETGYNLGQSLNWMVIEGMDVALQACQLKVLGAKVLQDLANLGMQVAQLYGQLDGTSGWAKLSGRIGHMYLALPGWSIGGGTSEVARNFIAVVGLGLPKG